MKSKLSAHAITALVVCLLAVGVLGVRANEQRNDNETTARQWTPKPKFANRDRTDMSEREKWKLARDAYDLAVRSEHHKDTEAATYYYEAALELLGNLNLASIDLRTHRVLEFQRKVLKSYDHFVASIETLPPSTGPLAILEASGDDSVSDSLEEDLTENPDDREVEALPIDPLKPPLPSVPLDMNKKVGGQINFFSGKGRKVMTRWMERAAYLFPRLRPILQEEGIPEEVMYLAMIESGLNPVAYSYAHAAGIWQFIPSTGRLYGLNVDKTFDERLHIEQATRAACRYLRSLYTEFGDWYLAFAAYNCGEIRVAREIKRSRSRNYWSLSRLPRQTRNYVPAYLAARAICEDPERYGFPKRPAEVAFKCEKIWVDGPYRLEEIAACAGHDQLAVKDLNPEYVRGVTRNHGQSMVRLPGPPSDAWDVQLASRPHTVLPDVVVHKVRRGETLSRIARKYGVSISDIKSLPENRRLSSKLKIGQRITVPLQSPVVVPATYEQAPKKVESAAPANGSAAKEDSRASFDQQIHYTVHRGESLGKIARRLGISVDEICRQNNIRNRNHVYPGQRLTITVPGGSMTASDRKTYTVQRGDTINSIARRHGQQPQNLMDWNNLRSSRIYPGQELIISN